MILDSYENFLFFSHYFLCIHLKVFLCSSCISSLSLFNIMSQMLLYNLYRTLIFFMCTLRDGNKGCRGLAQLTKVTKQVLKQKIGPIVKGF